MFNNLNQPTAQGKPTTEIITTFIKWLMAKHRNSDEPEHLRNLKKNFWNKSHKTY